VRRFTFFDKEVVKDPETGQPYTTFQGVEIRASTAGRGAMILGDAEVRTRAHAALPALPACRLHVRCLLPLALV